MSWVYHPELLARPVPRYTSFPTAAEFTDHVGAGDLEAALRRVTGDISLYLHIPFCQSICWYCGCNTGAANRKERLADYLEALHREIESVAMRVGPDVRVRRIAVGGGSPNAIAPEQFRALVGALERRFNLADPVWSIELDPRSLTSAWCDAMAQVGVRNASLGVQTFSAQLQAAIGRVQPDELIETAVKRLRAAGVTSLNFDLMYGLPGQTESDLEATLERAVELGADRIALFGYAHVPQLVARQRRIDARALPGQDLRFAMAELGYRVLDRAGYRPVGFDHFALPSDPLAQAALEGRLRRNFQGFTDDTSAALIGLGASAISSFSDLLVQNEKNAGRYRTTTSRGHLPAALGVRRDEEDCRRGAVIEALLCSGKAMLDDDLLAETEADLVRFIERGLVEIAGSRICLAPAALPYARAIAALFDPYRRKSARQFSSAV